MIPCYLCDEAWADQLRTLRYPIGERVIEADVCDECWERHYETFHFEY